MKNQNQASMTGLSQQDAAGVSGGRFVAEAQDMYGNTMSVEEWMDLAPGQSRHDFYTEGFNPEKPNIFRRT